MFAQFSDVYCILRLQRVLLYGFFYTQEQDAWQSLSRIPLVLGGGLVADRWVIQTFFYTGIGNQWHGLAPYDVFTRDSNPRLPVVSVNLIR